MQLLRGISRTPFGEPRVPLQDKKGKKTIKKKRFVDEANEGRSKVKIKTCSG